MEERCLGRVEIFGERVLGQRPAAKGDHPPARIADREHHPVAEAVIGDGNVGAADDEARFRHLLDGDALFRQSRAQGRPVVRRIAYAELLLDGDRQSAIGKIAARFGALGAVQHLLEEFRRELHDVIERGAQFLAPLVLFRNLGHRQPRFLGEPLDRFGKSQSLLLGQEGEDVARSLAAETVIAAFAVIDMKRRCLFVVERAAGPEIATPRIGLAPVPLHLPPDDG